MEVPDDGADDLLESVDRTLKQLRHGALSLLQVEASMPRRVLNILVENFEIEDERGRCGPPAGSISPTGWRCTGCRCRI